MTFTQLVLIGRVNNQLRCRKQDGASEQKTGLKLVQIHVNQHDLNKNESLKIQFCNTSIKKYFKNAFYSQSDSSLHVDVWTC